MKKLFLIMFLFTILGCECGSGADGKHTVYITAVEHANNLVWDADLVYVKSSLETTQEEKYCVNDAALKLQLEAFAQNKTRVTIHYHNDFIMWASECNGGQSVIVSVEAANTQ